MVQLSWIHELRKDDLVACLSTFSLDTQGTVDELRKRFKQFVREKADDEEVQRAVRELETQFVASNNSYDSNPKTPVKTTTTTTTMATLSTATVVSSATSTSSITATSNTLDVRNPFPNTYTTTTSTFDVPSSIYVPRGPPVSYASVIDQVRKWSVKFDGKTNPLEFIERVEELATAYELPTAFLPKTMPELLRDTALSWYRNNNRGWQNWLLFKDDFLSFFLPSRYMENLEHTIRTRKQKDQEKFKMYVIHLQELMRHAGYSSNQQLDMIYRNSRPEYQLYIKRMDFHTLEQLIILAGDYESVIREQTSTQHPRPTPRPPRRPQEENNFIIRDENGRPQFLDVCRRCSQPGHYQRDCRNPRILFCWVCGKEGTRTIDCCLRRPGNARGGRQ